MVPAPSLLHLTGTEAKILSNYSFKSGMDFLKHDSFHEPD